jgi:hypothetical protein
MRFTEIEATCRIRRAGVEGKRPRRPTGKRSRTRRIRNDDVVTAGLDTSACRPGKGLAPPRAAPSPHSPAAPSPHSPVGSLPLSFAVSLLQLFPLTLKSYFFDSESIS